MTGNWSVFVRCMDSNNDITSDIMCMQIPIRSFCLRIIHNPTYYGVLPHSIINTVE